MSFHLTAEDIVIEDGHILKANLRNEDDELVESVLDLNEHIGNDNGMYFQSTLCQTTKPAALSWMLTVSLPLRG